MASWAPLTKLNVSDDMGNELERILVACANATAGATTSPIVLDNDELTVEASPRNDVEGILGAGVSTAASAMALPVAFNQDGADEPQASTSRDAIGDDPPPPFSDSSPISDVDESDQTSTFFGTAGAVRPATVNQRPVNQLRLDAWRNSSAILLWLTLNEFLARGHLEFDQPLVRCLQSLTLVHRNRNILMVTIATMQSLAVTLNANLVLHTWASRAGIITITNNHNHNQLDQHPFTLGICGNSGSTGCGL